MEIEGKKEPDWFPEVKVYHNGSHYIGIPHTTVRRKKRGRPKEEVFVVSDGEDNGKKASVLPMLEEMDTDMDAELECPFQDEIDEKICLDFIEELKKHNLEAKYISQ